MKESESLNKPPTLRFTLLLGVLLIAPYSLSFLITEPYPAIILPSGAMVINVSEGQTTSLETEIRGVYKDGKSETIKITDLIKPAPPHFSGAILSNHLGIDPEQRETLRFKKNLFRYEFQRSALTSRNIEDCKRFFRAKIGPKVDHLEIIKLKLIRNLKTGEITSRETLKKSTFDLK